MSTLVDWNNALCAELGLYPADAARKTVLDLARVVAHSVDRPGRAAAAKLGLRPDPPPHRLDPPGVELIDPLVACRSVHHQPASLAGAGGVTQPDG